MHPLDEEDIEVTVSARPSRFSVMVWHRPTGLRSVAEGQTMTEATGAAKDDLLRQLEEAGGC